MKKIIIALATIFLAAGAANAQIGVVAGLTSSKTNLNEAAADVQNISQYHVGLAYKLSFGNFFAIQPAVLYNVKGSTFDNLTGSETVSDALGQVNFKTGFVEVPVQLQVGMGLGDVVRVYGFVEPFVGYAISNEITASGALSAAFNSEQTWENVKSRLEYGASLGVGVELIKHVQVSVKYFWNAGDLYGANDDSTITWKALSTGFENAKAGGIAASVGIFF